MKISALITQLQAMQSAHGDIDCGIVRKTGGGHGDPGYEEVVAVKEVFPKTEKNGKRNDAGEMVWSESFWMVIE